jgi:hypothetical protein
MVNDAYKLNKRLRPPKSKAELLLVTGFDN